MKEEEEEEGSFHATSVRLMMMISSPSSYRMDFGSTHSPLGDLPPPIRTLSLFIWFIMIEILEIQS